MCLGKLYIEEGTEPLLDNVTSFLADGERLTFISLFGETQTITGVLKKIDFSNSKIIVKPN